LARIDIPHHSRLDAVVHPELPPVHAVVRGEVEGIVKNEEVPRPGVMHGIDVGDDSSKEWTNTGKFSGTTYATGWQNSINQYLRTHFPDEYDDYGNAFTYVPVRIGADLAGQISVSEIEVEYDYTATVYYNPDSGNIINELQSLVPTDEEGWSLIEINVTTQTPGVLTFDNLRTPERDEAWGLTQLQVVQKALPPSRS